MILKSKKHKDSDQLKLDKILGLTESKNYREAIELLSELLAKKDSLSSRAEEALEEALKVIAMSCLKESTAPPSTIEHYEKFKYNGSCVVKICTVINLPPYIQALGWYYKGVGSGGLSDYDEAINCFDKSIVIQPSGAAACAAWTDKGTVLFALKKYKSALDCTEEAINALEMESAEGNFDSMRQNVKDLRERCEKEIS